MFSEGLCWKGEDDGRGERSRLAEVLRTRSLLIDGKERPLAFGPVRVEKSTRFETTVGSTSRCAESGRAGAVIVDGWAASSSAAGAGAATAAAAVGDATA